VSLLNLPVVLNNNLIFGSYFLLAEATNYCLGNQSTTYVPEQKLLGMWSEN